VICHDVIPMTIKG